MPQIEPWSRLPVNIRDHLVERMRDRNVSRPEVPDGPWYKDFGSFKLCGEGKYRKTFLSVGQAATGRRL
jgi:hypothetical protein